MYRTILLNFLMIGILMGSVKADVKAAGIPPARFIRGTLIIPEGKASEAALVGEYVRNGKSRVTIRIISKSMSFLNGRQRLSYIIKGRTAIVIPPIRSGVKFEAGSITVRVTGRRPLVLRLVTTEPELFDEIDLLPEFDGAIEERGATFAIINSKKARYTISVLNQQRTQFSTGAEEGVEVNFLSESFN